MLFTSLIILFGTFSRLTGTGAPPSAPPRQRGRAEDGTHVQRGPESSTRSPSRRLTCQGLSHFSLPRVKQKQSLAGQGRRYPGGRRARGQGWARWGWRRCRGQVRLWQRLFDATSLWGRGVGGQACLLPCPRGVTSRRVTLPHAVTYDPRASLSPLWTQGSAEQRTKTENLLLGVT